MKRIIAHTVTIETEGAKLQFQIKLPSTIKRVKGVKVTTNAWHSSTTLAEGRGQTKAGNLWLRIPDKRDVFFAEAVEISLPRHDNTSYRKIVKPSIGKGQKWFDGAKDEFFSIDVNVDNTILEGYYEDTLVIHGEYTVFIYLEIEQ